MTSYSPVSRGDGHHVVERDRRSVRHDAAEHDESGDQDHVAAPALGADEPRQPDRSRGAGDVLDRRQTRESLALQRLLHHARGLIPSAAGRGGRDETKLRN